MILFGLNVIIKKNIFKKQSNPGVEYSQQTKPPVSTPPMSGKNISNSFIYARS